MDKKFKIILWIFIVLTIVLAIALGAVSYFGLIENNNKISSLENEKNELREKIELLEKDKTEGTNNEPNENTEGNNEEANQPTNSEQSKNEINQSGNNTQVKKETIPTTDLVSLYYEARQNGANVFYGYINNGALYYFTESHEGNNSGYISTFMPSSEMKKYAGLNNIKRIKTYNIGTGVKVVPLLITEDGKVYSVTFYGEKDIKVELYEPLKNYKVEDILSHEGEEYSEFKLLLKDGTTKTVRG